MDRGSIYAAVLAAGRASRFGANKLAADLGGQLLVHKVCASAAKVCGNRVITVLGHDWSTVFSALGNQTGFVMINEHYADGVGSSIAAAAAACRADAAALLLLLADQPLVTAAQLRDLIDTWSGDDNEIVASSYAGTYGPPVLFPRNAFEPLCALSGDQGARRLLRDDRFRLRTVDFEPASVDVDTPADLDALREKLLHTGDDL